MSWHFSQALVAEYLAANSSAGAPFAQSSGSPTPQAYLCSDRMTAFSRLSRFGMTFAPLTDSLGADVLTWFLAAFPVRTSAQQEKGPESTERGAACGRTWPESLARYDHNSRSWRTPQCSLLEGLDEFSETWPRWGMMRDGACSAQSMPAHLTRENESGLWPTPCLPGNGGSNGKAKLKEMLWPTPRANDAEKRGNFDLTNPRNGLAAKAKLFPTPRATDHKGSGKAGTLRDRLDYAAERGATKSNTYATPQARDYRTGATGRWEDPERTRNLNDQVGGQLNPTWVEWLMGWPLGWTDLKPLEMDRFQQWLRSHGES